MMKSRPQPVIRRWMRPALLIAWASLAATGVIRAQTDAKPTAKLKLPAKSGIDVPRIAYTRVVLKNGLVVLLHEDHSSPLVSLDLWYHVGSKDDVPGKTGLAHMYEHMMFEGSANVAPKEHRRIIEEAGGMTNASTNEDRTSYVSTFPSSMLETVLWLEADRMAFGATRLDSTRFERERDVVRAEYNLRYDGAPANNGLGQEAVVGALFAGTGYGVTPMGLMSELSSATVQDLRAFFERYTAPNNATLAIAGDFKTADARSMVERHFAAIPRRTPVARPTIPTVPMTKETRLVLEDRNSANSHLWLAWRGAATTSRDRIALAALCAVLTEGPTSRLQRALVTGRQLATSLPARENGNYDLENGGVFQLSVFPRPGASMTDIELAVDSVLADVRDHGVEPAELKRWVTLFAVTSVTRLQPTATKARLLVEGEVYHHNPRALLDDIDAARLITPADLQRVARQYLGPGRVVLSIVPAGKLDLVSKPTEPYSNVTRRKTP